MANNFDLQLQAGVKLNAIPGEIEKLRKQVQAEFNASPINVKFDIASSGGNKVSAAIKQITSDSATAVQAAQRVKREFAQNEHVDRAMANIQRYFDKYRQNIQNNSVLLAEFQRIQQKAMSGGYGAFDGGQTSTAWRALSADLAKFTRTAQEAGIEAKTLGSKLKDLFSAHFSTALVMLAVNGLRQALQQVWQNVKAVDSAMTDLKKVTDETRGTYNKFLDDAKVRAQSLAATLSDTIQATADFARLGFSIADASALADAALLYKNVGDGLENITQASEGIISTMKANRELPLHTVMCA